jgi:hypothetical protein
MTKFIIIILTILYCNTYAESATYERLDIVELSIENIKNISYERLREITILKAAKITMQRGFTHFEFVYEPGHPIVGSVERQGNIVKDVYGNASMSDEKSQIIPSPIRKNTIILVQLCNEHLGNCKGLSARDVIRNILPY